MSKEFRKVLLFSTLNAYPFWAGSENLWFDFVKNENVNKKLKFHIMLADSPATKKKSVELKAAGAETEFYHHFNINFVKRNLYRVGDRLTQKPNRTLPWFNEIKKGSYDLVWFNVAGLGDISELSYAVSLCKKKNIPYWLLLQHGDEDFFLTSEKQVDSVKDVVHSAKRFIFISKKNQLSLERAIAQKLNNAFHSVNAITASTIRKAFELSLQHKVNTSGTAKFFNLGRFSPKDKAQHLLLEAFSAEEWKTRDWQLSFIGVAGFGQSSLEKLVDFYGIEQNRIKIIPHTDNVLKEIVKHDVLLMPSKAEGTPFAMIESMACGRPALGTPVGGIPELIQEQRGWLSDTTDVIDISNTLEKVWQQRDQWPQMGRNAQEFISKSYNQDTSFTELLSTLIEDIN